jgi:hypothetical protein
MCGLTKFIACPMTTPQSNTHSPKHEWMENNATFGSVDAGSIQIAQLCHPTSPNSVTTLFVIWLGF